MNLYFTKFQGLDTAQQDFKKAYSSVDLPMKDVDETYANTFLATGIQRCEHMSGIPEGEGKARRTETI